MRISRYRIPEIIADAILLCCAFIMAFFIRFDFTFTDDGLKLIAQFILPIIAAKLIIYYFAGLYKKLWRYAGIRTMITIVWSSILGTLAAIVIIFFLFRSPFPRSVIAIDGILTVALVGGIRFIGRAIQHFHIKGFLSHHGKPVLIVGAGDTGEMVLREMLTRHDLGYQPVGLIDDDPAKQRTQIHNTQVLGTRAQLQTSINKYEVEEVLICMPNVSRQVIRDVFFKCQNIGVKCRTMPGVYQLIDGKVSVNQIREVGVEDILGREPVKIDFKKIKELVSGKSVMVTGASGSIGSELCRQIYRLQPSSLIVLDQNESGLFYLEQELSRIQSSVSAIAVVADVTNKARIKTIFETHKPSIIFHAAAYKHVPMMERCIIEAITNNVYGTLTVAEAAIKSGAERFILISTDKAVEPVSIMGTSKALAERLVQALSVNSQTKFITVRFGNVLDSIGSVVPIFRQQIVRGGPVTVTHPDMTRYFMTIPEAMQLVIQSATMGKGGEIFVLDMGEQIRIVDLAINMIKLSGFEPEKDIPIVYSGMRPGEKLNEKLFWNYEEVIPTEHNKIHMARNASFNSTKFIDDILQMEKDINSDNPDKIKELLSRICSIYLGKINNSNNIK